MRWFDGLRTNSISSFKKLIQSFCSRFITCSRVPQPLDSLLSMSMTEGESVKVYAERYWEMFSEIDGDFDEVAIRTFKVGPTLARFEEISDRQACHKFVPVNGSS